MKHNIKLANNIRNNLIEYYSKFGGHIGSNLSVVEIAVAVASIFSKDEDKVIWDVSHNIGPWKMLTKRWKQFLLPISEGGVSHFSNPFESDKDPFFIGHTSTSISLASGLAKARDIKGGQGAIVAIIGDGSLTGGQALEALNYSSTLNSNLIIIVNDNEYSIDKNVGGIAENLSKLRKTKGKSKENLFKSFGFDYAYLENGNHLVEVEDILSHYKNSKVPIVIHIHTQKGYGFIPSCNNPQNWHWAFPFDIKKPPENSALSFPKFTNPALSKIIEFLDIELGKKEGVLVTPGTPFPGEYLQTRHPSQWIDVGIAEQNAVGFASALAAGDVKPYLSLRQNFVQRAYDQISQEMCINDVPLTLLMWNVGYKCVDKNHLSIYDIPMLSYIPNLVYLAPINSTETTLMLDFCKYSKFPTAIRTGYEEKNYKLSENIKIPQLKLGKYHIVDKGDNSIIILALGDYFFKGSLLKNNLLSIGVNATLINPRYINLLDNKLLDFYKDNAKLIITIENGIIEGGFGSQISQFFSNSNTKVINFGIKKAFYDYVNINTMKNDNNLSEKNMLEVVTNAMKER